MKGLYLSPLLFFTVWCHYFVFPKTAREDKTTIHTECKECGEKCRQNGVHVANVVADRKRPFPPHSHSLYFVLSRGRETTVFMFVFLQESKVK